jgi:hypothetical protein
VPEASVIRRVQALSGFIGRKGLRRRIRAFCLKAHGLTMVLGKIWRILMVGEGVGTDSVAVKCVDIIGNTKGVGRHLVNT